MNGETIAWVAQGKCYHCARILAERVDAIGRHEVQCDACGALNHFDARAVPIDTTTRQFDHEPSSEAPHGPNASTLPLASDPPEERSVLPPRPLPEASSVGHSTPGTWSPSWPLKAAFVPFIVTFLTALFVFSSLSDVFQVIFLVVLPLYAISGIVVSGWKERRRGVLAFLVALIGGFLAGIGAWLAIIAAINMIDSI